MPKWCKIIESGAEWIEYFVFCWRRKHNKALWEREVGLSSSMKSWFEDWTIYVKHISAFVNLKDSCPRQTSWSMIPNLKEIPQSALNRYTSGMLTEPKVGTPQAWKRALPRTGRLKAAASVNNWRQVGFWKVLGALGKDFPIPKFWMSRHRTSQAEAALNAQLAAEEAIRNEGGTWGTLSCQDEKHSHGLHVWWLFFSDVSLPFVLAYSFSRKIQVEWMAFVHLLSSFTTIRITRLPAIWMLIWNFSCDSLWFCQTNWGLIFRDCKIIQQTLASMLQMAYI